MEKPFSELGPEEQVEYVAELERSVVATYSGRLPSVERDRALARLITARSYILGIGPAPELPRPLTDAEIFGWDEVKS